MPPIPPIPLLAPEYLHFLLASQYTPDTPTPLTPPNGVSFFYRIIKRGHFIILYPLHIWVWGSSRAHGGFMLGGFLSG